MRTLLAAFSFLATILYATIADAQITTGDPGFGTNGVVRMNFPNFASGGVPTCIVPLADKKVLTGTLATINLVNVFGARLKYQVVRLKQNGSYDESFGTDSGYTSIDLGPGTLRDPIHTRGRRLALQSDGKIVGTAYIYNQSLVTELLVFRLNANGIPDSSFGTNGQVRLLLNNAKSAGDCITVLQNGKIVVGGSYFTGFFLGQAIVRLLPSGALDNSFNGNGIKLFSIGQRHEAVIALAEQPDGKLVLGSTSWTGDNYDMAVTRLNVNGDLDNSFNGVGWKSVSFDAADDLLEDLALQPDNKIVLAGWTNIGSTQVWAIARLNADGSPDNGFDGDGRTTLDFNSPLNHGYSVVIQQNGKLVMSGETHQTGANYELALCRFNSNGSVDSSFNVNGRKIFSVSSSQVDYSSDLAISAEGKLVMGGVIQGWGAVLQTNVVTSATAEPDCNAINIQSNGGQLKISGFASAPVVAVHIFNQDWATVYNQTFNNQPDSIFIPLAAGTYRVKVSFYTNAWSPICEKFVEAVIEGNLCPPGTICVANNCPQQTVDLNSAYSLPALLPGASVSWHTGTPATNANKLSVQQVQAISTSGDYYAAINITGSDCYSGTVRVSVTINSCATGAANESAFSGVREAPVKHNNVIIAPNPFTHFLVINLKSEKGDKGSLTLFDVAGKSWLTRTVQLNKGNNRVTLDGLTKLPGGSYFIRVMTSSGVENYKLVKQ